VAVETPAADPGRKHDRVDRPPRAWRQRGLDAGLRRHLREHMGGEPIDLGDASLGEEHAGQERACGPVPRLLCEDRRAEPLGVAKPAVPPGLRRLFEPW
jgi:hypothetical protein